MLELIEAKTDILLEDELTGNVPIFESVLSALG